MLFRKSHKIRTLIKGKFYKVNQQLEVINTDGKTIPIATDESLNCWIIFEGELLQLCAFEFDGILYTVPHVPSLPHLQVTMPKNRGHLELDEIDEYWNLERTEFYMLYTYKVIADKSLFVSIRRYLPGKKSPGLSACLGHI